MNTMAAMQARAMKGIITLKTWSGFVHHAEMPFGTRGTIDAKIITEILWRTPRGVNGPPDQVNSRQAAVRQVTMRKTRPKVKFSTTSSVPVENDRKRKT